MRKFVKKIILLALFFAVFIIISGGAFLVFLAPQYKYGYNASIIDKVKRLKLISSPKIILVGNSNLVFGINSGRIENEFGIPVVNLGLHGDLGNAFLEQIAKQNINKGDILIVCHSSYSDDGKIVDPELAWITLENNFDLYGIIEKNNYMDMAMAFPAYYIKGTILFLKHCGNQKSQDCYSRICFNKYGDNVFPRQYNGELIPLYNRHSQIPEINDICIRRLNSLNEYCKLRGAYLVIGGYPIFKPKTEEIDIHALNEFQEELQSKLNCPIISNYMDYIYEDTLFYNTNLHLTNEGAAIRTEQLIKDLHVFFETR